MSRLLRFWDQFNHSRFSQEGAENDEGGKKEKILRNEKIFLDNCDHALCLIMSHDGGSVASYQYNPVGATTAKTYENGLSALYRYDAAQRLVGLEHRKGLDLLAKIDYTLDSVGNRRSKTQSGINALAENYNYDAVDQLIEAQYGTARTVGYQYDAVGNRQTVTDNGAAQAYTANADNAYTSVGGISTETDLNGNMVASPLKTENGTLKTGIYAYDAQNRLTSATVNGVTTEFTYDARNRVVQRTSGNGTLNLTYSGWHLIEERNASGALEQVYVHGAGVDDLLVKITATGPAYYHHDGLGSTVALTGENGALLESYRYDAFGAVTILSPSTLDSLPSTAFANRFLFTGREWLSEIGLYDYRNRVYSAELGRFLQTDPIRFSAGDGNLYRYVGNNPINRIDPLGLLDSRGAFNHYTGGTGTSLRMLFGDINTSSVKASQFPKVANEISGSARDATISIDDRKAFSTSGDQALFLGDITLRVQETLTLKTSDCSWKFDGTLKSFDDKYDFNKSTHRGPIGEFRTGIGRGTTGTPYWIEIRGSKQISESGKIGSG